VLPCLKAGATPCEATLALKGKGKGSERDSYGGTKGGKDKGIPTEGAVSCASEEGDRGGCYSPILYFYFFKLNLKKIRFYLYIR
jgi:hypothetical protein